MASSETLPAAARAFNAANAASKAQRWKDALAGCDEALGLDEGLVPAHLLKARCLVHLGEWMAAREAFAQTLRREPANYSAWLEAGHLCRQMGEPDQALAAYQRARVLAPDRHEALLGLARLLAQLNRRDEADAAYDAAVRAAAAKDRATLRQVHWRMGQYVLEMGHPQEALGCFDHALKATPAGDDDALNLRAEVQIDAASACLRLGQRDAAMHLMSLASAATQEATLTRLAMLGFRNNFWQEAIEVSRRCVALHPQSAWARWNLAHLLAECWQMSEAEQVLQQAEALAPMPGARTLRAAVAGKVGDADAALVLYEALAREEAESGGSSYASSAAMCSLYSDRLSAQEVADLHRRLFARWGDGARSRASFRRAPMVSGGVRRRLRLGIVSADFHHQHPVAIFMLPLLRELDRSRFELFVYFVGDSYDDKTTLARARSEHWVEATTLNTRQLARRIDADEIDVLLDLAGHTGQHRMRLFAQRAAPVQVTYLGYPGSTGVPNMDVIVGDAVVTPEGCEALYSERVARLPGTVFCYAPEDDYPCPVYTDEHAERPLTFGSFNNVPKLTPRTLALWARVLDAVPGSRLLLRAPSFMDARAQQLFSERLVALGVDPARVTFHGPVGLDEMMAAYADIDIALDPVPYNGGTTSLQALWMGVPVLTQRGAHFVSRMGASFMTAAGLAEWVADDDDGYVDIARRMATDRRALLTLKQGLRSRLTARPGWDVAAHTRALERALEQALEQAAGSVA